MTVKPSHYDVLSSDKFCAFLLTGMFPTVYYNSLNDGSYQ